MEELKPKNIREYKDWLRKALDVHLDDRIERRYKSVSENICVSVEKGVFWNELKQNLKEFNDVYEVKTGYKLFDKYDPSIDLKTYESILTKSFRKNIIENSIWPEEPNGGWILPDNWFSKINDIVRTILVVKYFDGVEFLVDELQKLSVELNVDFSADFEAKEEGYYAAHTYVHYDVSIPAVSWDTEKISVSFEIQITTQIQEVLRKLLHQYYTKKRLDMDVKDSKWQWDYKTDEFSVNYLGHILHYVEGMIMEIRDKQKTGSLK